MKNLLAGLFLTLFLGVNAMAAEETYEKGYSIFMSSAVTCSSGTVTNLTSAVMQSTWSVLGGYHLAGFRIQNQDTDYAAWIGASPAVSTAAATAVQRINIGEMLIGGANGVWPVTKDPYSSFKPIYCKAADAATNGVTISITPFGYR